jgi:hypothetical protein
MLSLSFINDEIILLSPFSTIDFGFCSMLMLHALFNKHHNFRRGSFMNLFAQSLKISLDLFQLVIAL